MSAVASYVQLHDGEYFVGSNQVTLRSVIASWQRGMGPERIQESFPHLPLVTIYGAITYYLEHQTEMDANFHETDVILAAHQASAEAQRPEFFAEMRARLAERRHDTR